MVAAPRTLLAATLVLLAISCGSTPTPRNGVSPNDAVIRVDAPVSSATIVINGRELGTIAMLQRGIALSPGTHRLEVRHPNYHAHYELLELGTKERRVIKVELAERLP